MEALKNAREKALQSQEKLREVLTKYRMHIPHDLEDLIKDPEYFVAKDRAFVSCRIETVEKVCPPMCPPPDPDSTSFVPRAFRSATGATRHVDDWVRNQSTGDRETLAAPNRGYESPSRGNSKKSKTANKNSGQLQAATRQAYKVGKSRTRVERRQIERRQTRSMQGALRVGI